MYTRSGTSDLAHGILSIITCGLWVPVWICAQLSKSQFRCSFCGGTDTKQPEHRFIPPDATQVESQFALAWSSICKLPARYVRWHATRRLVSHVTCECPYCDGRVEFLKSSFYELRRDPWRKYGPIINCPHCGKSMETYL